MDINNLTKVNNEKNCVGLSTFRRCSAAVNGRHRTIDLKDPSTSTSNY